MNDFLHKTMQRILIIEDDHIEQKSLCRILHAGSLKINSIESVTTLAEGLGLLRQGGCDVLLLDVHLPDSVGMHTITTVRQEYPDLPIVVITGSDDIELGIQAIIHGADEYLVKDEYNARRLQLSIYHAIERRLSLIQVQRDKEQFFRIFKAAPVGMFVLDKHLQVLRANQAAAHLTRRAFDSLTCVSLGEGLNCLYRFDHDAGCGQSDHCCQCQFRRVITSVLETGQAIEQQEVQAEMLIDERPTPCWFRVSVDPIELDGQPHVVVTVIDISESKRHEQSLCLAKEVAEQSNRELEQMNIQLGSAIERAEILAREATVANHAKSQFLANMSHEIRTPINAIMGFSEVLLREPLTDKQKEYARIILNSSEGLLGVINDVLDLSKIESERYEIHQESFRLSEVLNAVKVMFTHKAMEKQLELTVTQRSSIPPLLQSDPGMIRQSLINLVANAIKFTECGYVHVGATLHSQKGKPWLQIDVADSGIGVSIEQQALIFEAFVQADGAATRKYGGTGLGLSITKRLVELLGGRLICTSTLGQGSVFSLDIPVEVPEGKVIESPCFSGEEADIFTVPQLQGRVLVAEDCQTNSVMIRHLLTSCGLEVTVVRDGKQALQALEEASYDLVLMDIQMPQMDGYEATRLIRYHGWTMPVIALTANAMKGDRERCLASGCDDYIAKPFRQQDLLSLIQRVLPDVDRSETMIHSFGCD